MTVLDKHMLLRHRDIENIHQIEVYEAHDGYQALRKALNEMSPADVTDTVKKAGLRGRGGAGFPTGLKWSFMPKDDQVKYVVVNADESEPGTFKDREIMEMNPHEYIEGCILCAYAVGAQAIYTYGRGEFLSTFRPLQAAIDDAYAKGYLGKNVMGSDFSVDFYLHLGAGAYICGEETALLESLEGERGQPRAKPPFPAQKGLYAKPTVVNNVETLASVAPIIRNGVDWYRQYGTEKSPGTKIFCLSGCVNKPGNYELPLGTTIRYLIEECGGGIWNGNELKGILPAGASSAIIGPDKIDTPMDYEAMQEAGTMLGSASFIIMDSSIDAVWAAKKNIDFFKHESCGKCSPCREGTFWLKSVYERLNDGHGSQKDFELLTTITDQMEGNCFCLLGEFAIPGVRTSLELYKDEYLAKLQPEKANGNGDGKQHDLIHSFF